MFFKKIWDRLKSIYNSKRNWEGKNLSNCFNKWTKDKSVDPSLAAITIWFIWNKRNLVIFENLQPSIHTGYIKVLGLYKKHSTSFPAAPLRDCNLLYLDGYSLAFFDASSQNNKAVCEAGGVIKTFNSRVLRWTLNGGEGTNTKVEMLGIWVTLTLASDLSLPKI
jgi:hypothetical protein